MLIVGRDGIPTAMPLDSFRWNDSKWQVLFRLQLRCPAHSKNSWLGLRRGPRICHVNSTPQQELAARVVDAPPSPSLGVFLPIAYARASDTLDT